MTSSSKAVVYEYHGIPVNQNYMRNDQRQNLRQDQVYLDQAATIALQEKSSKHRIFKQWLLDNGAIFEEAVEYPAVFGGGLQGMAAKQPLGANKGFIFIPNTLILSAERVKACPKFTQLIKDNSNIFGDVDYRSDKLLITTFLLHEHLQGDGSFWKPYIDVMFDAELVSNWSQDDVAEFMDPELKMDVELYQSEVEATWSLIENVLEQNSYLFPGYTK